MTNTSAWVKRICVAWQKSLDAIFEVGDLLIAAKKELPGQFEKMVRNELPFKERAAEQLMCIARDKRLREANHGSLLPTSWRTLYELTRLDDETFYRLIEDGTLTSEMTRADVVQVERPRLDIYAPPASASRSVELTITQEAAPAQGLRWHGGLPQVGATPQDLACQIAGSRALRVWDVLRDVGPADAGLIQQFRLLASERPQEAEAVRDLLNDLAAALAPRVS